MDFRILSKEEAKLLYPLSTRQENILFPERERNKISKWMKIMGINTKNKAA